MTYKQVLLNLKVLSQIRNHDKLQRSSEGVLSLDREPGTLYSSVKRFLMSESRGRCIKDIANVVEEVEEKVQSALDSKYLHPDDEQSPEACTTLREQLIVLVSNMEGACAGVSNLRDSTYSRDAIVCSELDILIARLTSAVNKIRRNL